MKLELKHLDFVNNGKVRLFNNLTLYSKDIDLQNCQLSFDGNKEPYLIHQRAHYYLDQIKPYKRSLSQLTQEIEHDGVRFVPKEWLRMNYIGENIGLNPATWSYRTIQKLQEWHFAIDIPSELYIEMEAIPTAKPNIA